ncbi:MAG: D-aminoacyl-tRNA deacylase, partial [Lachnospiraceae bacterium]|nr:D-aminoacyl-tRNA deacylase [Lachnospiraceae bacterium]
MRFLIQVVTQSEVRIANEVKGKIGRGSLVFIGIGKEDTKEIADKMIAKLLGLRIFADENGKTNLALKDIGGELLLVSQFT